MIRLPHYNGRKVGVFGLGLSGCAAVASLIAGGAEVYAWDENSANLAQCKTKNPKAEYKDYHKWPWKKMETLVLSPGVPLRFPKPHSVVDIASIYGCEILGDVELLMQAQTDARYIGITGTNGKSTTTALIAHMLKGLEETVQMGGNIGTPALALEPLKENGIYVLEMSSFQLDLMIRGTFNIAVLLNISPDHLDRHGDMEGYAAAKQRIFDGMGDEDCAIISADDEYSQQVANAVSDKKALYSWQSRRPAVEYISVDKAVKRGLYVKGGRIFCARGKKEKEESIALPSIPTLKGVHNQQNMLAAFSVGLHLGYTLERISESMQGFAGLAHRMESLGTQGDVEFVNDSKATNAEAAAHALATYEGIYWILGGIAKEGGIESLQPYFGKIKKAYLIGEASKEFAGILDQHGVVYEECGKMVRAVLKAARDAKESKEKAVVLLSPAAASFDQFPNFEKRGDYFRTQVDAIMTPKLGSAKIEADKAS